MLGFKYGLGKVASVLLGVGVGNLLLNSKKNPQRVSFGTQSMVDLLGIFQKKTATEPNQPPFFFFKI